MVRDWLHEDDANYGLLLVPVALWLTGVSGLRSDATPPNRSGATSLLVARADSPARILASEFFTQRFSIWLAIVGMVVFCFGWRQVRHWWLPLTVLLLAIPLPALVTQCARDSAAVRGVETRDRADQVAAHSGAHRGQRDQHPERDALRGRSVQRPALALGTDRARRAARRDVPADPWPARDRAASLVLPLQSCSTAVRIFLTAFLVYFVDPELGQRFHAYERRDWPCSSSHSPAWLASRQWSACSKSRLRDGRSRMRSRSRWIPALLLLAGCLLNGAIVGAPRPVRCRCAARSAPSRPTLMGVTATDDTVTDDVGRSPA